MLSLISCLSFFLIHLFVFPFSANYFSGFMSLDEKYNATCLSINICEEDLCLSVGKLDGNVCIAYVVNGHDASQKTLNLSGYFKSGCFKLILVDPEGTAILLEDSELFTQPETYSKSLDVNFPSGKSKLTFVGSSFSGDLKISKCEDISFNYIDRKGEFPDF